MLNLLEECFYIKADVIRIGWHTHIEREESHHVGAVFYQES